MVVGKALNVQRCNVERFGRDTGIRHRNLPLQPFPVTCIGSLTAGLCNKIKSGTLDWIYARLFEAKEADMTVRYGQVGPLQRWSSL